jgi:hypothetical protein
MLQCDAPGSAELDPDDGFVERPWRASTAFVFEGGVPAGDGLWRTHRGAGSSQPNDSGAAAKRHPRHQSTYPDGDRSIRPRVDASHLSAIRDSRRERREPPFQPCFLVTDGWFKVPRRVSSPKGAGTRGHSITSVITTATRARSRRPYPRTTLDGPLAWPPKIVVVAGGSERSPESDHPLPAVPRSAASRFLCTRCACASSVDRRWR